MLDSNHYDGRNADASRQTTVADAERLIALAAKNPSALENLRPKDRATFGAVLKALHKNIDTPTLYARFPEAGPLRREVYPKQMEHFAAGKDFKERLLMAANRFGKTDSGAYETSCHSIGWYPPWWEGWVMPEGGNVIIGSKTNKMLKKVTQLALFGPSLRDEKGKFRVAGTGMIPRNKIILGSAIFKSAAPGTLDEIQVQYKDSAWETSTLEFRSYEQGRGVFEGTAQHFVWLDEEPSLEIYSECLIRTMTTKGRVVITFTPLDGMTEVVVPFMPADFSPAPVDESDVLGMYA